MPKINVKSVPPTFRRAGLQFTRAGTVLDTADLTEAQLDAIAREPNLHVRAAAEDGAQEQEPKRPPAAKAKTPATKAD